VVLSLFTVAAVVHALRTKDGAALVANTGQPGTGRLVDAKPPFNRFHPKFMP